MNRPVEARLRALCAVALVAVLCGCTIASGGRVDYRSGGAQTNALEVPPDLTQLSRSGRYQTQGGSISASATTQGAVDANTGPKVAVTELGDYKVERDGNVRWLRVPKTPEQIWPQVLTFWTDLGFTIEKKDAAAGTIETNWAENRAKLPQDIIRKTLGGVLDSVYSTGELEQYRTRIERTPTGGSEVFITQRAMEEVYTSPQRDYTRWQPKAPDPEMEAEMLSRLLVKLGAGPEAATAAVDNAVQVAKAPDRARLLNDAGGAALEMDDSLDRAWRRVGVALDHSGFTVEDRDRAGGLYYVRYVDPNTAGKEGSGNWFSRLFNTGSDTSAAAVKYRVALKAEGDKTRVSVLDAKGSPDTGEAGKRIVTLLLQELK